MGLLGAYHYWRRSGYSSWDAARAAWREVLEDRKVRRAGGPLSIEGMREEARIRNPEREREHERWRGVKKRERERIEQEEGRRDG